MAAGHSSSAALGIKKPAMTSVYADLAVPGASPVAFPARAVYPFKAQHGDRNGFVDAVTPLPGIKPLQARSKRPTSALSNDREAT